MALASTPPHIFGQLLADNNGSSVLALACHQQDIQKCFVSTHPIHYTAECSNQYMLHIDQWKMLKNVKKEWVVMAINDLAGTKEGDGGQTWALPLRFLLLPHIRRSN